MSEYKHGNWYCKPTTKSEAKEIIERALESGARKDETVGPLLWSAYGAWGVYNGRTFTQSVDFYNDQRATEYTIEQVRELFPLPGEHTEQGWNGEGLPPVGTVCEAWHKGSAQGIVEVRYAGDCMVLWNVKLKHEQCSAAKDYSFRLSGWRAQWIESAAVFSHKDAVLTPE